MHTCNKRNFYLSYCICNANIKYVYVSYSIICVMYQDKDQETKMKLSKLIEETKANIVQLEEKHKAKLEEAVKEATADKENLKQIQQHHFEVCI